MIKRRVSWGAGVGVLLLIATTLPAHAVRVLPAALHVEQAPGTEETYTLTLINDTDEREELQLYIGDWLRLADGEHDWGVPRNGARWVFERAFVAGETLTVRYAAVLRTTDDLAVRGAFQSASPQIDGAGSPADRIAPGVAAAGTFASTGGEIRVERTVESIDDEGRATVRLTIRTAVAFSGLTLYETFSERVALESVDPSGAQFDTVNRSNADWIVLSHDRVVLEPNESHSVTLTVDAPIGADGTYWSAVFVESQPQVVEQAGTRVLSIYRAAIKVYVTALGTGRLDGQVIGVEVPQTDPLMIEATFENTGTVELVVTGAIEVIDRTGDSVRAGRTEEFKILPGARRVVVVMDPADSAPLPAGIYQAIVSFQFGGESPVVGVRGFRVR